MVAYGIIQLLDSSHGRPLQNWRISSDKVTTVGRALENDIVLADPYVSRSHAYIRYDEEQDVWQAISISQQQFVVDGQTHGEVNLSDGTVFRLGAQGCSLRFNRTPDPVDNRQTMSVEALIKPKLVLDQQQLAKNVQEIIEDDFFKKLKKSVDRERNRHASP